MQMSFFGEGSKDISSMRVFYATLVGLIVFKEHLSKINWMGFVIAIASIIILSFS
jgi:multidrug transporter EmrE-like cation transporter